MASSFTEYQSDGATKPYYYPVTGSHRSGRSRCHYPDEEGARGMSTMDHNHQLLVLVFTHGNVNG